MKLAAGGDEAGFQNLLSPVAGPQARRRDVGPGLRFAGQQGCADLQAVSLDECRCLTGLNLGREGGQSDDEGAEKHDGCQSREGFEHVGG